MNTRWDRLEPNTTDETLLEGLQARVADPLWMMARQWQNGEFDGEDAATPLRVIAETESYDLTTVSFGEKQTRALQGNLPLEPVIEAIRPNPASAEDVASLVAAALAALNRNAGKPAALLATLRQLYPFEIETYQSDHPLPEQLARRLRMLSRHAFDPYTLVRDQGRKILNRNAGLTDWVARVVELARARGHSVIKDSDAWNPETLSYEAQVSGHAGDDEYQISLNQYGGGRLDWYSFDASSPTTTSAPETSKRTERTDTIPLPLTYTGQPVSRFWEFEDGEVHFGGIAAGPADISRMIVANFAAIGGDDTFVLPVEAEVGSITRVKSLLVIDSFGTEATTGRVTPAQTNLPPHCHRIAPAEAIDRGRSNAKPLQFGMFTLGKADPVTGQSGAWLPILPVTANAMNGKALERVTLRRDEEANLAWAVEEAIEGPFGKAMRRRQMWEIEDPEVVEDGAPWPYRLQTSVPPWWIPLVPERINDNGQIRLRRARLGAWDTMDPATAGPKSALMDSTRAVIIDEAAVPASGVRMERHWQVARAYDGRPILWQSWKRHFGASDRASGLVFDAIARKW